MKSLLVPQQNKQAPFLIFDVTIIYMSRIIRYINTSKYKDDNNSILE